MTIVFYQKDATVYAVQYQTSENSLYVSKLDGCSVVRTKYKVMP